jgi:hypothetical protein
MKLTTQQRKNLALYAAYRSAPPTLGQLLRKNLPRYLLAAALTIVVYMLAPATGIQSLGLILIGLFLGALLRDIGHFWRFVRFWPVQSAVLDWQRVDNMLSEPSTTE